MNIRVQECKRRICEDRCACRTLIRQQEDTICNGKVRPEDQATCAAAHGVATNAPKGYTDIALVADTS